MPEDPLKPGARDWMLSLVIPKILRVRRADAAKVACTPTRKVVNIAFPEAWFVITAKPSFTPGNVEGQSVLQNQTVNCGHVRWTSVTHAQTSCM